MIRVIFKNVGQGDSIIIEWEHESKVKIGIIDCNLYNNKNPVVEYLIARSITEIEFVVLTHYHLDHFSGFSEVFDYCKNNNIRIKSFHHTISSQAIHIYDKIFTSKKLETANSKFFDSLDSLGKLLADEIPTTRHTKGINLSKDIYLSFLAPDGKVDRKIARQISRKVNKKIFTDADINKLSIVLLIKYFENGILFTSDAPKESFRILKGRISTEISIAQIPHHGSIENYYDRFWSKLSRINKCPVVFSVGDEPKDKLPNRETVEFIDKLDYDIHSTNIVYGILEYFFGTNQDKNYCNRGTSNYLSHFSRMTKPHSQISTLNSSLSGDQIFIL